MVAICLKDSHSSLLQAAKTLGFSLFPGERTDIRYCGLSRLLRILHDANRFNGSTIIPKEPFIVSKWVNGCANPVGGGLLGTHSDDAQFIRLMAFPFVSRRLGDPARIKEGARDPIKKTATFEDHEDADGRVVGRLGAEIGTFGVLEYPPFPRQHSGFWRNRFWQFMHKPGRAVGASDAPKMYACRITLLRRGRSRSAYGAYGPPYGQGIGGGCGAKPQKVERVGGWVAANRRGLQRSRDGD